MSDVLQILGHLNELGAFPALVVVVVALALWWKYVGRREWRSLGERVGQLGTDMKEMKIELTKKIEGVRSELKEDVSGLEGKISGLEGKISGLEGKVTGLEGKVTGLAEKVDGLSCRVAKLEGAFDATKAILIERARPSGVMEQNSPYRLSDVGREMAADLNALAWADAVAETVPQKDVDQEDYRLDAYAQQHVFLKLSDAIQDSILRVTYEKGVAAYELHGVLAIVLREKLIALRNERAKEPRSAAPSTQPAAR